VNDQFTISRNDETRRASSESPSSASPVTAVAHVLSRHMPDYSVEFVRLLGEGLENEAYEVNGELVLRFSKAPDAAREVRREARLLRIVLELSPLPTPEPQFTSEVDGCLGYFKLPGVTVLDVPAGRRRALTIPIARSLGALLATLHSIPFARLADVVEVDRGALVDWRDEAEAGFRLLASHIPSGHHPRIKAFFDAGVPAEADMLVFSHNDLGIEHVLVDGSASTVTGIIDWTDAAIVDPAHDFGRIYRDLGPAALDAALDSYGVGPEPPEQLRSRAEFFARCSVFEDLGHGVDTEDFRYVDKSLGALNWLFPAVGDGV
jgi:aminoglycoside phosphotransferase (APT) family kinase protein